MYLLYGELQLSQRTLGAGTTKPALRGRGEHAARAARELGPLRLRYRHAVQPCRYEGRCALERSPLRLITPALSSH